MSCVKENEIKFIMSTIPGTWPLRIRRLICNKNVIFTCMYVATCYKLKVERLSETILETCETTCDYRETIYQRLYKLRRDLTDYERPLEN